MRRSARRSSPQRAPSWSADDAGARRRFNPRADLPPEPPPDPWSWPDWSFAGEDGTFGNRYDDPRGKYRVLYAAGQRRGAFVETLARFRPDPAIVAAMDEIDDQSADEGYVSLQPGIVPADWLAARCLGIARHHGAFCDIGHSDSLGHLRDALADRLVHYRLEDLDASDIRRRAPRRLTQELSRYVFERGRDEQGRPLSGIRYLSRLGDDLENWAIFEGADPIEVTVEGLSADDQDLRAALQTLDLTLG